MQGLHQSLRHRAEAISTKGGTVTSPALIFLWTAVVLLGATILGAAAALLSWLDQRRVPRALLIGGSAAGGTIAIAVAAAALFT